MGALWDDTPAGTDAGSAYVFTRSGGVWTQQAKLLASDGAAGDIFGVSVALSGDTAVVGALWDDTPAGANAGSAYVFIRQCLADPVGSLLADAARGAGDPGGTIESILCDW